MTNRPSILLASVVLVFGLTAFAPASALEDAQAEVVTGSPPTAGTMADEVEASEPAAATTAACPRRNCCGEPRAGRSESESSNDGRGCRCGRHAGTADRAEAQEKSCCGRRHGHGQAYRGRQDRGVDCGSGPSQGRSYGAGQAPGGGPRGGKRAEMEVYRTLLENHHELERTIEQIPDGVRTTTTASDPDLVTALRRHVTQMKTLVESGGHIRMWDPLFAEIFRHTDKIEMTIENVDGGVAVTETSGDEDVVALIRAHALKVDQFIARGVEAYEEETPLPEGYPTTR